MRICILTQADTLAWTQHYVDAFRQRAEVLTVGPGIQGTDLEDWGIGRFREELIPNDIETELEGFTELQTVLPEGWEPDLVVGISKGGVPLRPMTEELACPTVYLSIDTWQSPGDYIDAQCYDFVFAAQRSFCDRLAASGAANVSWLPLGCNPAAHYPVETEPDHDIAFVGNVILPIHQHRYELLTAIQNRFTTLAVTSAFKDETCQLIARGKLAFNHSAVFDVNMRIFEVMAMGRPVLTNRDAERNGLLDLFEDGEHLIVYDNADDLVDKARHYLADDEARAVMAAKARDEALAHHTYRNRVDTILDTVAQHVPGFGEKCSRPENPYTLLLPYGAESVLDIGLGLNDSAGEVRRRGTKSLAGIINGTTQQLDDDIYDTFYSASENSSWPRQADAVVLTGTELIAGDTLEALRRARNLLRPGGTLIVRLTANDFSRGLGIGSLHQLDGAIQKSGLHMNLARVHESGPESSSVFVRARKRTRLLREIFVEAYADLPHLDCGKKADWVSALGEHF